MAVSWYMPKPRWAGSICSALLEHQLLSNQELLMELGDDAEITQKCPDFADWPKVEFVAAQSGLNLLQTNPG